MAIGRLTFQAIRGAARSTPIAPRPFIRTYAAAASGTVKPPVALYGIDGTYATALVGQLVSLEPVIQRIWKAKMHGCQLRMISAHDFDQHSSTTIVNNTASLLKPLLTQAV